MSLKTPDYFVILLYGTALFVTVIVLHRMFNMAAAWEWFLRGYTFACGMIGAMLVLHFLYTLFSRDKK